MNEVDFVIILFSIVIHLGILGLCVKIYTEIMKERNMNGSPYPPATACPQCKGTGLFLGELCPTCQGVKT